MISALSYSLLSGLLLVATAAVAADNTIYKWRDSGDVVHYTDTPPPAGTTLLKGPKLAPAVETASSVDDKPMLRAPCRPDITAAECEAARLALQPNLEDLERTTQGARTNRQRDVSDEEANRRVAVLRAKECSDMRNVLVHLRDRQSGKSTEILTAEERASVPSQIVETEAAIASACR